MKMMENYFHELAAFLDNCLQAGEQYTSWFSAESSDFVRFNHSLVRQPGHVSQIYLSVDLINGLRHATSTLSLSGSMDNDRSIIEQAVRALRAILPSLPEDPHLLIASEVQSTSHILPSLLPDTGTMVDEILSAAHGVDLVGFLAAGPIYRGFANSFGQRNWHQTASFNFDWSLYQSTDKAVKTTYAGFAWQSQEFHAKFSNAATQLAMLQREPVTLQPGAYRVYLAPAALSEIVGMLNWDGLSEKSLRTTHSSLRRMRDESVPLHSAISLTENTTDGLAPAFQGDGFIKPGHVALIDQGRLTGSMISPRSAKEYGIQANGADGGEAMASLDIAAGSLPLAKVLDELGTGVFISNLWYLNFSDRANCRMTGMTRFATFWVENGEIKAPLNVMRFDDSLFRVLGENLIDLTVEREFLVDTDTYEGRGTVSARLPGALIKDFMFVL